MTKTALYIVPFFGMRSFGQKLLKYGNAQKNLGKYSFEYERIGGRDPYPAAKRKVTKELIKALNRREREIWMLISLSIR